MNTEFKEFIEELSADLGLTIESEDIEIHKNAIKEKISKLNINVGIMNQKIRDMEKNRIEYESLLYAIKTADSTWGGDPTKYQSIEIRMIDDDEYLVGTVHDRVDSNVIFIENHDFAFDDCWNGKKIKDMYKHIYAISFAHYHRQQRHDNIGVKVYTKSPTFQEYYGRRLEAKKRIDERTKK